MVAAITGTASGVGGPALFALYLTMLVFAAGALWWLHHPETSPMAIPDGIDDCDIALFGFGGDEHRAVAVAMLRLCQAGVLDPGDAAVRERARAEGIDHVRLYWKIHHELNPLHLTPPVERLQPLPAGAHPVEHAVYQAAAGSPPTGTVRARASRSPLVAARRKRLFDMGFLLYSQKGGARRSRWLVWSTYVAVLVALFLLSGRDDQYQGWLTAVLWLHFTVAFFLVIALDIALSLEPATPHGRQIRHALYRQLEGEKAPAGAPPSLRSLALSGFDDLWKHDPCLALALFLPDRPISHGD